MSPSIESNQEGFNKAVKRGDGRLSVTLLGLMMAAAAATVFQLTITYLEPHDSLSRSVPADAAVYVHINTGWLGGDGVSALLPDNIRADEIAKFAVVNGNKGLSWGALFGWRRGHQPTDEELMLLDSGNALKLDDQTFLLGDENVQRLYGTEPLPWSSLAEDVGVARSLDVVRGLAPIQGYLNSVIAPPQAFAGASALLKELEPLVFALDRQEDGYYAVGMATREAAGFPSWLGFAPAPNRPADVDLVNAPADLSLFSDQQVFDPIAVFFGKIEKARAALGLERAAQLDAAADRLRQLLNGPVSISLFSDELAKEAYIGAEYPTVAPEKLMAAVAAYISAALPERTSLLLPDGDMITEFRLDPSRYMPAAAATSSNGDRVLELRSIDFKLIYRNSGRGGVIIANNDALLTRFAAQSVAQPNGRCATLGGSKLIINTPIIASLSSALSISKFPVLTDVASLKFGLFIENNDGVLISCGYR